MALIHAITPDELTAQINAATGRLSSEIFAIRNELDQLKQSKDPNEYLTVKETAEHIGVTTVTLRKYTKAGILKRYTIGSRIRYKRREVDAAMKHIHSPQHA